MDLHRFNVWSISVFDASYDWGSVAFVCALGLPLGSTIGSKYACSLGVEDAKLKDESEKRLDFLLEGCCTRTPEDFTLLL